MRTMWLAGVLAFSVACGEEEDPVSLSVRSLTFDVDVDGAPLAEDRDALRMDISIHNRSNGLTPLAATLFSVDLEEGLEIIGSPLTELLDDACLSDASVAEGGTVECSVLFETPEFSVPSRLNYALVDGSRVSTDVIVCDRGETLCGYTCADLTIDPEHCGECSRAVNEGGTCVDGEVVCFDGDSLCGDTCVDLLSDPQHCGSCETSIPAGGWCEAGESKCPVGETTCDGVCVNTSTDPTNCGACGNDIVPRACENGEAGCTPDEQFCDGSCVGLNDPEHCGSCGVSVSEIEGSMCVEGELECPSPERACADECVNITTDDAHCGGCGDACPSGGTCDGGICELVGEANGESCEEFCDDLGYRCAAAAQVCTSEFEIDCDQVVTNPACDQRCLCRRI